ncbi:hypothetical protein NA57DRAFT_74345 [Rhizodiscina lignyota]|uniref:Uncharacterized protein n=1 Tax=Rhizodiscina lignyota TaxID=1504668 RepID=A0A9P4IJF5_9PEZI|nr:hypothetical protein NA57DRAFT_74345 [Rhizodiscina lignyota]
MGLLERIRGAKRAAEEHQKQASEQQQKQQTASNPPKQSYRHKPTHAAQDALTCMGGGVNDDLRERIREQHKRRNELMASESQLSPSFQPQWPGHGSYQKRPTSARSYSQYFPPGPSSFTTPALNGPGQSPSRSSPNSGSASASQGHRTYFSHSNNSSSLSRHRVPLAVAPTETSVDESVEYAQSNDASSKSSQTSISSQYSDQGIEIRSTATPRQRELYDMLMDKPSRPSSPTSTLPNHLYPSVARVKSEMSLGQAFGPLSAGNSPMGTPRARSPLSDSGPASISTP